MTPAQQKNVELIRAMRKELRSYVLDARKLQKSMEGMAGQGAIIKADHSLQEAREALKYALGEIGREEYQREDED